jgi:hypothetical protein
MQDRKQFQTGHKLSTFTFRMLRQILLSLVVVQFEPYPLALASGPCQAVGMAKKRTKADRLQRQTEHVHRLAPLFHASFGPRLAAIALASSLGLHLHQVGQRTFTSKLLSMPSTHRHRGGGHPSTPATPPCVRVRTRRFELVTLTPIDQSRKSDGFEVSIGKSHREGLGPGKVPRATSTAGRVISKPCTDS